MGAIASSLYTLEDQRRMASAKNYFEWQAGLVKPELGRRVLEIGCGIGNFTGLLLDREAIIAIDVDPGCIEELKLRFRDQRNLHALVCDAADVRDLARFRPDSCVCLNVLEHIDDDRAALSAMASVIPRGGKIVLLLPAFPSLYGPIDRNLGHFRRYTRESVRRLAAAAQLRAKIVRYVNMPGMFGWWVNARILRREAQSPFQIQAFDRFILPLTARLEKLVTPPFGQSLFAVLVKP